MELCGEEADAGECRYDARSVPEALQSALWRFVGPFRQSRLGLRAETGADGCGTIFEIPYGERYRKHRFYASLLILDSFVGAADRVR